MAFGRLLSAYRKGSKNTWLFPWTGSRLPGAKCQVPGAKCRVPGAKCQVTVLRVSLQQEPCYLAFCIRPLMCGHSYIEIKDPGLNKHIYCGLWDLTPPLRNICADWYVRTKRILGMPISPTISPGLRCIRCNCSVFQSLRKSLRAEIGCIHIPTVE